MLSEPPVSAPHALSLMLPVHLVQHRYCSATRLEEDNALWVLIDSLSLEKLEGCPVRITFLALPRLQPIPCSSLCTAQQDMENHSHLCPCKEKGNSLDGGTRCSCPVRSITSHNLGPRDRTALKRVSRMSDKSSRNTECVLLVHLGGKSWVKRVLSAPLGENIVSWALMLSILCPFPFSPCKASMFLFCWCQHPRKPSLNWLSWVLGCWQFETALGMLAKMSVSLFHTV